MSEESVSQSVPVEEPQAEESSAPLDGHIECADSKIEVARNEKADSGGGRPSKPGSYSPTALQDMFLNGLRRENIDVVVYFSDGTQERGAVRAFDTFTILLENRNSGKSQLIYKHSVARIFPTRSPAMHFGPDRAKK